MECDNGKCEEKQCCEAYCSYYACPDKYTPVYGADAIKCEYSGCTTDLCCEKVSTSTRNTLSVLVFQMVLINTDLESYELNMTIHRVSCCAECLVPLTLNRLLQFSLDLVHIVILWLASSGPFARIMLSAAKIPFFHRNGCDIGRKAHLEEAYIARFPLGNRADAVASITSVQVVGGPQP